MFTLRSFHFKGKAIKDHQKDKAEIGSLRKTASSLSNLSSFLSKSGYIVHPPSCVFWIIWVRDTTENSQSKWLLKIENDFWTIATEFIKNSHKIFQSAQIFRKKSSFYISDSELKLRCVSVWFHSITDKLSAFPDSELDRNT